jgi:hypothetical protein
VGPEPLPGVIPYEVDVYADFGVSSYFRRGAITQSLIAGLTEVIIDANNILYKVEKVKGKMSSQSIRDATKAEIFRRYLRKAKGSLVDALRALMCY